MEADEFIPLTNQQATKETSNRIQCLACHKTHSSFSCPSSPTSHWANSTENRSDDYADLGSCNTNQLHNQVQSQGQDNYLPNQQANNIHFLTPTDPGLIWKTP